MEKSNRAALGFLLAGIAAAGRAFLAVPETVGISELSLTALALAGYLVLSREALASTICGAAMIVLEVILLGENAGTTGIWALLRLADLSLLTATVWQMTALARHKAGEEVLGKHGRGACLPVTVTALLAVHGASRAVQLVLPGVSWLGQVSSGSFVVFSLSLLWYTLVMNRAYNRLRSKKELTGKHL